MESLHSMLSKYSIVYFTRELLFPVFIRHFPCDHLSLSCISCHPSTLSHISSFNVLLSSSTYVHYVSKCPTSSTSPSAAYSAVPPLNFTNLLLLVLPFTIIPRPSHSFSISLPIKSNFAADEASVPLSTSTIVITTLTTASSEYVYCIPKQHNSAHLCAGPTSKFCVWATPSVQGTSPTLTVTWQGFAEGNVTYTVKYSTQPGEVNTPPEGALEVTGISGTSTILTALWGGTTYYIWVVGVAGGEGPQSDRISGVTYDSELGRH